MACHFALFYTFLHLFTLKKPGEIRPFSTISVALLPGFQQLFD